MSIKQKIKASFDFKLQEVIVPEWADEKLYLRTLDGHARNKLLAKWKELENSDKLADLNIYLLVATLCDAKGVRIFDDSPDDFAILQGKNVQVIDRVAKVAIELNGLGNNALEDAAKN